LKLTWWRKNKPGWRNSGLPSSRKRRLCGSFEWSKAEGRGAKGSQCGTPSLNPQPLTLNSSEPHHRGFSASHWQPGTCGANDSLRLDCAKSLLGVQICIPGSERVRPPQCMAVLRQFSGYSCTSAPSSRRLNADLRPCRAFSLLLASSALCAAFAFRFDVGGCSRNRRAHSRVLGGAPVSKPA